MSYVVVELDVEKLLADIEDNALETALFDRPALLEKMTRRACGKAELETLREALLRNRGGEALAEIERLLRSA